jgi:acyl-CoA reductase-like NAD-dependent aldehyde dehydrogenase
VTHQVATKTPAIVAQDAIAIVDAVAAAFPAWVASGPTARRTVLFSAADSLDSKINVFVESMAAEIGATQAFARFNVGLAADNGQTVRDEAHMPFGHVGACGYGRSGGKAGIAEFADLGWITLETVPGRCPI